MSRGNFKVKVTNITYRRNGVSGRGFWTGEAKGDDGERLVIIRPKQPKDKGGVECYVISVDDIEMQWRGDCYNEPMDKAILKYRKDNNIEDD